MNQGFFNPRNFHPPPRNFHPPNPQFQNNINQLQSQHQQPNFQHPNLFPPPRPNINLQQQQIPTRKRALSPPEPPRFSELKQINPDYKKTVDEEVRRLDERHKEHLRDPESHPFYGKEWQLFWNRKADEFAKRGEDPSHHDFHDEWCDFFLERMKEIHEEEVKWKVDQTKRKFGIKNCDYPVLKKLKDRLDETEVKSKEFDSDHDDEYEAAEEVPPWKVQNQPVAVQTTRKSRFDQPPPSHEEVLDHPKFRLPTEPLRLQEQQFQQQEQQFQQPQTSSFQNPQVQTVLQRRIIPEAYSAIKKAKQGYEKIAQYMMPTVQLENVPISMTIADILDFFGNKLRSIVGCFRVTDYIRKISSETVYLIIMDEHEVEVMENMREIFMERNIVKISTVKLLNGSAAADETSPPVPGAPQSLFLTGLEKRTTETTLYLRIIAKTFDRQKTLTGIRICHNAKMKKSRNFGFAHYISKASVDELNGRNFKTFDYEIKASRTHKIPLLINVDHADLLMNDPLLWSNQVRGLNLLNVNIQN